MQAARAFRRYVNRSDPALASLLFAQSCVSLLYLCMYAEGADFDLLKRNLIGFMVTCNNHILSTKIGCIAVQLPPYAILDLTCQNTKLLPKHPKSH